MARTIIAIIMLGLLTNFAKSSRVTPLPLSAFSHHSLRHLSSSTGHHLCSNHRRVAPSSSWSSLSPHHLLFSTITTNNDDSSSATNSPWNNTDSIAREGLRKNRFRQHVNPLSSKYQQPTSLSPTWPESSYTTPHLPLFLDIGCGKGGFLLDMASLDDDDDDENKNNYLGLEIRPSVAAYAQSRVSKRDELNGKLLFVGCNVNVDLDRLLSDYRGYGGRVRRVCIQFPDPHFKKRNEKRRVVNEELVTCLINHMEEEGVEVFLQSDIKEVLDDMRLKFREFGKGYFEDVVEDVEEYLRDNPLGVQTEREISVLKKDLPVYRTLFRRTKLKRGD